MQQAAVSVRPYRTGDLQSIVTLDRVCFAPPFRFSLRTMRHFVEARNSFTLVAESLRGVLVGFIVFSLERADGEIEGYVITLDVDPTLVRAGIATRLVRQAELQAADSAASRMRLHVHTMNLAAISFYQASGYICTGHEPEFYGEDRAAYLYQKGL